MQKITPTPIREWTVLVYQGNGCHAKHGVHHVDLLEMQQLPSNDDVTILTQGHKDYKKNILERREIGPFPGYYELIEPVDTVKGRQNQPEQLADFVKWGIEKYPSKKTCLVISGLSGGSNGMIVDEKDGLMFLADIRKGLRAGLDGKELDILAFDGHWMACIEAATEFEGTAGLMVASQGRSQTWDYEKHLGRLVKESDMDVAALADHFVSTDQGDTGMSVLRLDEVPNVLQHAETLFQAVQENGLSESRMEESESVAHFKDFHSVVKRFTKTDLPKAVRAAALETQNALDSLTVKHHSQPDYHTCGVSIATFYDDPEDGQAFRKATSWDEFLTLAA